MAEAINTSPPPNVDSSKCRRRSSSRNDAITQVTIRISEVESNLMPALEDDDEVPNRLGVPGTDCPAKDHRAPIISIQSQLALGPDNSTITEITAHIETSTEAQVCSVEKQQEAQRAMEAMPLTKSGEGGEEMEDEEEGEEEDETALNAGDSVLSSTAKFIDDLAQQSERSQKRRRRASNALLDRLIAETVAAVIHNGKGTCSIEKTCTRN